MTKTPKKGDRSSTTPSSDANPAAALDPTDQTDTYKVGPGRPPREYQFRPGQSGNPKGRPRKESMGIALKQTLERAMRKKAKVTEGEQQRIVTLVEAGLERLVHQYAQGDRYARRDLFWLAGLLGMDLRADAQGTNRVHTESGKALLDRFVERQMAAKVSRAEHPVIAPPDLLDDDPEAADDNG